MSDGAFLGKVLPESYPDFLAMIQDAIKDLEHYHLREFRGLNPDYEPHYKAYQFMNGLGGIYGAALARAYTQDLQATAQLPSDIPSVIEGIWSIYNDLEGRRSMKDDSVVRQAALELPEYIPDWLDLDETIIEALASYEGKGVYFNDFYYSAMQFLSMVAQGLAMFQAQDRRKERVVFEKEGPGGEYIPEGLSKLTEDEERKLLQLVIEDANRRIAQRTYYGPRQEDLPRSGDFSFIRWSNGPARWFLDGLTRSAALARERGVKAVTIDADVVMVPFHSVLVEKVLDVLDDHPLYDFSVEAGSGENLPATDRVLRRIIRSMLDQTHPEEDPEERALFTMDWFDIFQRAKAGDEAAKVQASLFPMNQAYSRLIERWFKS